MEDRFDVVVLGAGSGGEMLVGALGDRVTVAVVEAERVGGECPFTACVPSKVVLTDVDRGATWGEAVERRRELVHDLDDSGHARSLVEQGAVLVRGHGRLDGPGRVVVATTDGGTRTLVADHVVLATGAGERWLDVPGIEDVDVWTSHDAWTTLEQPRSLLVVGAGAVGLELATAMARFGTETHLVDRNDQLLHDLPADIGDVVTDGLLGHGVTIHAGVTVTALTPGEGGTRVQLSDGSSVDVERVVLGIGKEPRLDDVGLETVGLTAPLAVGTDGVVAGATGLWAVGDVTGHPGYTHTANALGEVVAWNIIERVTGQRPPHRPTTVDLLHTPHAVFTDPPVAWVGAFLDDDEHVVAHAPYRHCSRAYTDGVTVGHVAICVRRADREVVGIGGAGRSVDELLHGWAIARAARMTVDDLRAVIQQFPTYGELTKLAAMRAHDLLAG